MNNATTTTTTTYARVTVTIGRAVRAFDVATPSQLDAIRHDATTRGARVSVVIY